MKKWKVIYYSMGGEMKHMTIEAEDKETASYNSWDENMGSSDDICKIIDVEYEGEAESTQEEI